MANPIRQLLSQTSYVADGVSTVWNFAFSGGYLDKSHVKAKYLDANRVEHQIAVTSGMFLGQYQLNITPPLAAGSELVIYRDTPKEGPLVDFADRAALTEQALDLNAKQAVFVAAESSDGWTTIIEATNADRLQTGEDRTAARDSAANALTSENAASDKAAEASGHANAASGQADLAANTAATTQTLRDSIVATQGSIGYLPPVAYAAGLSMTLPAQTVNYAGQAYAPILSGLPFVTSGTFETAKFRLIQGVASVDLAAPGGAAMLGYDGDTVQTVLDAAKPMATYAALRAYTGRATGIRITTQGIAGIFQRTDRAGLADNGGSIIIDAENRAWERIFDGPVSVGWFGAVTGIASSQSSAMQAAIDAVYAAGYGDIQVTDGTWRLDAQVTVKPGVRLLLGQKAVIVQGSDTKLFRMKPRSRFEGGSIDVRTATLGGFTKTAFEFVGTDSAPNFRGVEPTVVRTEIRGDRGVGKGTAFHLFCSTAVANIYGVQIDATLDGLEVGAHLEKIGPSGDCWINGNGIKLRAVATVNLLKMTNDTDGSHIDANSFYVEYQTVAPHTSTVIDIKGRFNKVGGMVWDFNSGSALVCSAASGRNMIAVGGLLESTIADSGMANTINLFTTVSPGMKIGKLQKNSSAALPIEAMDVILSNAKNIQWRDSEGAVKTVMTLTASNSVIITTPTGAGSIIADAFLRFRAAISGTPRFEVDGNATAGNTSLMLWDVSKNALSRVSVGAADSGGVGFKALRVPN